MNLHPSFNLISEIPFPDWEKFEKGLSLKKYQKGQNFLNENQVSDQIGFIAKGAFRLFYRTEKKEINYNFFAEGQFAVNYESFLKQLPSDFIIEALEDSEVYIFTKSHIYHQYSVSHAWERFGRKISEQIFLKSRERIKELMFLSAEQRYLNFIREHKNLHLRLPLYHIASYLSIDATSLSRIRKELTKKNS